MKKTLSFLLCVLLIVSMFSGCELKMQSSEDKIVLNVYNWGQYISDGSDDCMDVIAAFEEAYPHIKVNYMTYDSNEVMYTKLAGGGITVDVIIPSDYMVARMIEEDMLVPLDFSNIPTISILTIISKIPSMTLRINTPFLMPGVL